MQWGASQCVMQWGASMYYAVGSRQTHYIMVLHVFAQPSEERHTVTVQRFRRTSQIRRWRSYPPKPQRCARTHHDRRWSSKCYSRGQNGVHDVVCRWNMIQIFLVFKVFLMCSSFRWMVMSRLKLRQSGSSSTTACLNVPSFGVTWSSFPESVST